MAAPSYTENMTDIFAPTTPTTTGWTALGGGASGLNAETDYFIHGTGCTSKNAFASTTKGMIYNGGSDVAGGWVMIWITHQTANSLDLEANGGLQVIIGSGTADYHHYYVSGSDVIIYDDRWLCIPIYAATGTVSPDTATGTPGASLTYIGGLAKMVGGPTKGAPFAINAIRYTTGIGTTEPTLTVTDGDLANGYGTFVGAAQANDYNDGTNGYNRWGLFQQSAPSNYKMQGRFNFGSTGTAVDFRDANRTINILRTTKVNSDFNGFEVLNASSNVELTNITVASLSTVSRGFFTVTASAIVNMTGCTFVDMGVFSFREDTSANDCTFRRCLEIVATNTAEIFDLIGSTVDNYQGSTGTAAVRWTAAVDPDGYLDDMTFVKGTGTTHAIELGTNTPSSITLRGWTVSGYNAANGNNDSVIYNNSGKAITVNVVGNVGTISYRNGTGASTTIVANPVTLGVTVTDSGGTPVSGARVLVRAGNTVGGLPYLDSVTLSESSGTVTVTHTAHGLSTGQKVVIDGTPVDTDSYAYLGVKTITVTGANSYTYTGVAPGSTGSEPTSPTATAVIIEGTTNGSGYISDTRTYSVSQAIDSTRSNVRKSSAADNPKYRTSAVSGTISSASGLDVNVLLLRDQ